VASRRVRCVTSLSLDAIAHIAGVESVRLVGDATELLTSRAEPVVRELLDRDPTLAQLEVTGAALEDAFLEITKLPNDDRAVSVSSASPVDDRPFAKPVIHR